LSGSELLSVNSVPYRPASTQSLGTSEQQEHLVLIYVGLSGLYLQ